MDEFDHRLDEQFARLRDSTMAYRPDLRGEFDACLTAKETTDMADKKDDDAATMAKHLLTVSKHIAKNLKAEQAAKETAKKK